MHKARSDWTLFQTAAAELSDARAAIAAGAMLAYASKGNHTQHPTFKITGLKTIKQVRVQWEMQTLIDMAGRLQVHNYSSDYL